MPRTVRSRNLDLIRWLNFNHKNTCKMLAHLTNANYVSKMANGDMEIEDRMARRIEDSSHMPDLWMDRDNIALLKMCRLDYELHQNISSLPEDTKKTLLAFVETLSQSTNAD